MWGFKLISLLKLQSSGMLEAHPSSRNLSEPLGRRWTSEHASCYHRSSPNHRIIPLLKRKTRFCFANFLRFLPLDVFVALDKWIRMKCNFLGKQSQLWLSVSSIRSACSRSWELFIKHLWGRLTRRLMAEKCKFKHVNLEVTKQICQRILVFSFLTDFARLGSKYSMAWLCAFELRIRVGERNVFWGFSAFSIINR